MPSLKSIFGYAILIGSILILFWVTPILDVANVAVRRSIIGGILFIGLIGALYFNVPRPLLPDDRSEIEAWEELIAGGQPKFLLNFVFSGFKWFIPLLVFFLIRDYFRETSMVNNLGIYGAIGLAWMFNFYLNGVRLWHAGVAYRSRYL